MPISYFFLMRSEIFGRSVLWELRFFDQCLSILIIWNKNPSSPLIYIWDSIFLLLSFKTLFYIYSGGEIFYKAAFSKMVKMLRSDIRKSSKRKMKLTTREPSPSVRVSRELWKNNKGIGEVSSQNLVKRGTDETMELWKTTPYFKSEGSLNYFLFPQVKHWFLLE